MGIFDIPSGKRAQKMFLNENAKVNEIFKPGTVFRLGKSEQERKIIGRLENRNGFLKIEVLWGEQWVPGTITHQILEHYLKKDQVFIKQSDQSFYKPS